jgi:hypothetical protein
LRCLGLTESFDIEQLGSRRQQAGDAAETRKKLAAELYCIFASHASAEQYGKQLGIQ